MLVARFIVRLCYLWPFDKGRWRLFTLLSESTKGRLDHELPQPARMKSGIRLFVRPNDHLSRWFRYFGRYERETSQLLRELARPGEVFLDVGANLGLHSLGVAKEVGCHVAAFEPSPPTADCLEKSVAENELEHLVRIFRVAISDEEGSAELVEPEHHVGQAALEAPTEGFREGNRYEVPVARLDTYGEFQEYIRALGARVGLLKMDIEGAEERALRGMESLLRQHRPAIVMEIYDGNLNGFGSSREAIFEFLANLGYELVREFDYNGLFLPRSTVASVHAETVRPALAAP